MIDLTASASMAEIGERLRIIPNHACPVSNLFDAVALISGTELIEIAPVTARGRVD